MVLEGTPQYKKALKAILKKHHIDEGVITHQLDELAQNPRDAGQTHYLGQASFRKTYINIPGKMGKRVFRLYYYVTSKDNNMVPVYVHEKSQEKVLSKKFIKSLTKSLKSHLETLGKK